MHHHLQQPLSCLQDKPASLLGLATSAEDARVMLEALEAGTSGVVLKTEDPLQVCPHGRCHEASHTRRVRLCPIECVANNCISSNDRACQSAWISMWAAAVGAYTFRPCNGTPHSVEDAVFVCKQARKLAAYLKTRSANRDRLAFEVAKVTSVQKVGMGDRCSMRTCHHLPISSMQYQ